MIDTRNYAGKTIYMGIDVHKKTYCCVSICEGEVVKRDTISSQPEGLLRYIKKFFPNAKIISGYEAGFSGFHLHRALIQGKIENIVIHAASIEVSARDRVKTDKRDALKIATQLSAQRLRGIFVPNVEQEAKRNVSRLRFNFWKLRQQVGARLKSLLFTQGLIEGDDNTRLTKKWMTQKLLKIEKENYPDGFCFAIKKHVDAWEYLTEKIKEIEEKLKVQAMSEKDLHRIFVSVPGIGFIHARQLANELGDMSQFHNEKELFSYTGLTPSEFSSGEHVRQGHISRQGRSVLRNILIEAAWVAIGKDPSLHEIYDRISRHRGGKRAIVGVARRLVGRIRSCLKNNKLYEMNIIKKGYKNYEVNTENEKIIVQEKPAA